MTNSKSLLIGAGLMLFLSYFRKGTEVISAATRSYREEAIIAGEMVNLPHTLILAVIQKESSGRMNAPHSNGELGLMGLKLIAVQDIGDSSVSLIPQDHIIQGAKYLSLCIERAGNLFDGLRYYNAGIGNARKSIYAGKEYAEKVLRLETYV